jgi:hypothetical protein
MKKLRAIVVALSLVLGTVGNVHAVVQYPEVWEIGGYGLGGLAVGAAAFAWNAGNRTKKLVMFLSAEAVYYGEVATNYLSKKASEVYDYCTETEVLVRESDGGKVVQNKHQEAYNTLTIIVSSAVVVMSFFGIRWLFK